MSPFIFFALSVAFPEALVMLPFFHFSLVLYTWLSFSTVRDNVSAFQSWWEEILPFLLLSRALCFEVFCDFCVDLMLVQNALFTVYLILVQGVIHYSWFPCRPFTFFQCAVWSVLYLFPLQTPREFSFYFIVRLILTWGLERFYFLVKAGSKCSLFFKWEVFYCSYVDFIIV